MACATTMHVMHITARPNVPGQAFHDWRSHMIATKFTAATSSSSSSTPPSAPAGSSSSHSSTSQQQQLAEWVNIVAAREALSVQRGLPSYIATHPAAKQRLELAKALVALARADADADTAAQPPAELNAAQRQAFSQLQQGAAGAAPMTGASSNADRPITAAAPASQLKQDQSSSRTGAGSQLKLHQQQPTVGEMLQQATGGAAGSTDSTNEPETTPDRELLLEQLTALLRSQPYKPSQTDVGALDVALMHFVHKGPQGRLYVQDQPW
jgi:hypothetical protein